MGFFSFLLVLGVFRWGSWFRICKKRVDGSVFDWDVSELMSIVCMVLLIYFKVFFLCVLFWNKFLVKKIGV